MAFCQSSSPDTKCQNTVRAKTLRGKSIRKGLISSDCYAPRSPGSASHGNESRYFSQRSSKLHQGLRPESGSLTEVIAISTNSGRGLGGGGWLRRRVKKRSLVVPAPGTGASAPRKKPTCTPKEAEAEPLQGGLVIQAPSGSWEFPVSTGESTEELSEG